MFSVISGTADLTFLDQCFEVLEDNRETLSGHIFLSFKMMDILELPIAFEVHRPNLISMQD